MSCPALARPFQDCNRPAAAANRLLDESPIACANIVPDMASLFRGSGKRGEAGEAGMPIETDGALHK